MDRLEGTAFKYNGKELDQMHGLNLYDYSARYYEPAIGRFTTVDPLAEKKYWSSPYAYCLNNPLKYIDPDGRDEWEINEKGEMVNRIENKEKTGFYVVNSDGDRIDGRSVEFEYADISHSKGTIEGLVDSDGNPIQYESFSLFGDESGTKIFEFMAQQFGTTKDYGGVANTRTETMEWSINRFGNSGKQGINHVSTSFQTSFEARGGEIIQSSIGISLRESTHNHPYSSPNDLPLQPSGNSGDIGVVKVVMQNYTTAGVVPIFRIYSGASTLRQYISYNENGVIKK